ncbi:MAG TPA: hypothetical protein DER01_09735, partial [Phycisphaerales bacterium]|nr:hypothetical protein [Phycisphaerales bacterium]
MSMKLLYACLAFGLIFTSIASADTMPDGGNVILAPQPTPGNMAGMRLAGKTGNVQIVPTTNDKYAYRITVDKPGNYRWDVQMNIGIPTAIREGDVYLLKYDARCIESMNQEGTIHSNVERNGPPHNKAMSSRVDFGTQWTTIYHPFVARKGYAFDPNGSVIALHL